jgi:hypothetical protein
LSANAWGVVSMKNPNRRAVVTVITNIENAQCFSLMLIPPNLMISELDAYKLQKVYSTLSK